MRAVRHVEDRLTGLAVLEVRPLAALGPRVLAQRREVGPPVRAEPELDQLPVALVAAGSPGGRVTGWAKYCSAES